MTLGINISASKEWLSVDVGKYGSKELDMSLDQGLHNRSAQWSAGVQHPFLLSEDTRWPSHNTGGATVFVDTATAVTGKLSALGLYNLSGVNNVTTGGASDTTAAELVRDITLGVVLAVLCLATMFGNAMVLHAVRTDRRLQTVSNMFIVSLAIADLTVGLIVMPVSAIYIFTEDWLFGVAVCQFWIGVDYIASTASILNLFILSMDRYWSVTMPLKYLRKRTKKRALIMISLVWFASSLWLIPIVGWHHFEHGGVRTVPEDVCDTEYATNTALKILTGILNFYLPLAIMYGLYTKIFIEIKRRSKLEIGLRTSSGGHHTELAMTTSLSDDSDDRPTSLKSSGPDSTTKNTVIANCCVGLKDPNQVPEHQQLMITKSVVTDCETETDFTDEDISWQNRGGYTNLTLIRVSKDSPKYKKQRSKEETMSMERDTARYVYDETVCDAKTEQLRRYYYEEHPMRTYLTDSEKEGVGTTGGHIETALTSSPDTPIQNTKVRFQVHSTLNKTPSKLPKETHPAKNQYVKQRLCQARAKNSHCQNSKEPKETSDKSSQSQEVVVNNSTHDRSRVYKNSKERICSSPKPRTDDNQNCAIKRTHLANSRNGSYLNSARHNRRRNGQSESALVKQAMRWKKKLDQKKHRPSSSLYKEIKAARQLGVIMGAFTLCFFPYFVCFMVVAFCESCVSLDLMTAVTWIGYLNSTLNPLLYPLCNQTFRRKFRRMLRLSHDDSRRQGSFYYAPKHVNTAGYANY